MGSYSPYLQNVCTVFMLLFGINFNVYYLLLIRKFAAAFKDEEVRLYLFFFAAATGLITWNIRPVSYTHLDVYKRQVCTVP